VTPSSGVKSYPSSYLTSCTASHTECRENLDAFHILFHPEFLVIALRLLISTLHIWSRLLYQQLEDEPCCGDRRRPTRLRISAEMSADIRVNILRRIKTVCKHEFRMRLRIWETLMSQMIHPAMNLLQLQRVRCRSSCLVVYIRGSNRTYYQVSQIHSRQPGSECCLLGKLLPCWTRDSRLTNLSQTYHTRQHRVPEQQSHETDKASRR